MSLRLNKFIARATGMSRRAADKAIEQGSVSINGRVASLGDSVSNHDEVKLNGHELTPLEGTTTIILNKPRGYVCSRKGQGSRTVYDLLPKELHGLKTVGRLDKDSSGLLLLSNDGDLANRLTHPSHKKSKEYEASLDKPLTMDDLKSITGGGVMLDDGVSRFYLKQLDNSGLNYRVTMHEGRNRQIRRTFAALGYEVNKLHRIKFDDFELGGLKEGNYREIVL